MYCKRNVISNSRTDILTVFGLITSVRRLHIRVKNKPLKTTKNRRSIVSPDKLYFSVEYNVFNGSLSFAIFDDFGRYRWLIVKTIEPCTSKTSNRIICFMKM